jgi:hypothetical protein
MSANVHVSDRFVHAGDKNVRQARVQTLGEFCLPTGTILA